MEALKPKNGLKRKKGTKDASSRKKIKVRHNSTNDLPWKTVRRPREAHLGFEDGILELEEVEGVEVVYEETEKGGKVARFNVRRVLGILCL